MAPDRNHSTEPRPLEKLGIKAIQERLEVSPIIADPSGLTPDEGNGDDNKTYICNVFPPMEAKADLKEVDPTPY